jgi:hypothetical protein
MGPAGPPVMFDWSSSRVFSLLFSGRTREARRRRFPAGGCVVRKAEAILELGRSWRLCGARPQTPASPRALVVAIPAGGGLGRKRAFAQEITPAELKHGTGWRCQDKAIGEEIKEEEVREASDLTERWQRWFRPEMKKTVVPGSLDCSEGNLEEGGGVLVARESPGRRFIGRRGRLATSRERPRWPSPLLCRNVSCGGGATWQASEEGHRPRSELAASGSSLAPLDGADSGRRRVVPVLDGG